MKNQFYVFILGIFLFSQTANTTQPKEQDQFYGTKSSDLVEIISPFIITMVVHYILAPSMDRPRPVGMTIAAETVKTLFTAVIARTVWAPIESKFRDLYDTDTKKQNIDKEKEQKQEAVLSNLDRLLPQIRKYLVRNNTKAAIDIMANMMLRIRHLHTGLDIYSSLIIKDTIEATLLNRASIPCDFYEHVMDNLEEKDIRVRGSNMTYYRDFLKNWNIPNVPCSDMKSEDTISRIEEIELVAQKENCSNDHQGLMEALKLPMGFCKR